jgi:hypothetical protein
MIMGMRHKRAGFGMKELDFILGPFAFLPTEKSKVDCRLYRSCCLTWDKGVPIGILRGR